MARKSKRMIAAEQAVPLSGNIYNVAIYVNYKFVGNLKNLEMDFLKNAI